MLAEAATGELLGLLSRTERKNEWTIAELAGDVTPDGMQRLLNFYSWSAGDVRDDLRAYVAAQIGDAAGVLIPDETGSIKKGTRSAGVPRQYSGTAGGARARWAIEECFQAAKNETGLDHYQVRRYDAWYRHATLSMLAPAFLAVTAAQRCHMRGDLPGVSRSSIYDMRA